MKHKTQILHYNAIFEPCEEGGFSVTVPRLPGLVTEGDTYEKALENAKDAITGYLELMTEAGEELPEPDSQSFSSPVTVTLAPS